MTNNLQLIPKKMHNSQQPSDYCELCIIEVYEIKFYFAVCLSTEKGVRMISVRRF